MDRISKLPDEILCQILSFFPTTKEAASTSLLSKRWRNLFAFSPSLCIKQRSEGKITDIFVDFVDRVLATSDNSIIRNFSIRIKESVVTPHINRWMINVLSRGIVDLTLDHFTRYVMTTLPLEIFTCKTIVYLKLGNLIRIDVVPENAYLPALKTLILACVLFSGCAFEALISACPVLEKLGVFSEPLDEKHGQNVTSCPTLVSCPTLERLHLSYEFCRFGVSRSITFDTPKLTSLVYGDFVADEYPVVNLNSLVEAEISLEMTSDKEGNPENLIKGLRNVKILKVSCLETSKVLYSYAEAIPLFENLAHLTIVTVFPSVVWKLVPLLLKKSPNLETLVIQGPWIYKKEYDYGEESQSLVCECLSGCTSLSSCRVKVLEITDYRGTKGELEQMNYFLEKLLCLELVNIRASFDTKGPCIFEDKYNYREESQSLARECWSECTSLSSCLVKVLEITEYKGTKGELEQTKHFVEKLPCLELVKITASFHTKVAFTTDVLMLPKDSKIQAPQIC